MSIIRISDTKKLNLPKGTVLPDVIASFKEKLNSYINKVNTAVSNTDKG